MLLSGKMMNTRRFLMNGGYFCPMIVHEKNHGLKDAYDQHPVRMPWQHLPKELERLTNEGLLTA